jgi:DNA mismatch repair protein MutL
MLPSGRRPVAVLNIAVPPDTVDVNVHPTKAEVRLRDERAVFGVLQRAVRRAIADRAPVPSATAGVWGVTPASSAPEVDRPPLFLTQKPVQMPMPSPAHAHGAQPPPAVQSPMETSASSTAADTSTSANAATMVEKLPLLRAVGQVNATYVVAEGPDGMYLVDQHAAHERGLYERFLEQVRNGRPEVQGLLQPLTVELSATQQALVREHTAALAGLGFEIDHFGDAAHVVRAVPASLRADDVAASIGELLDRMSRDEAADLPTAHDPAHRAAASLACHAAVRAGMSMAEQEQRELLRLLETCETPRTCPHGRPTMVHLAADAIAREFRRK